MTRISFQVDVRRIEHLPLSGFTERTGCLLERNPSWIDVKQLGEADVLKGDCLACLITRRTIQFLLISPQDSKIRHLHDQFHLAAVHQREDR
jgi:hypothetical protein